ncbi:MAG: hypothetical protein ACOC5E_00815 [Acidobacteriota bacterium]
MIVLVLLRWLLLLAALLALGVALDRLLTWLDRQGLVSYRAGRSDRDPGDAPTDIRSRRRETDRAPEGFPDDPFPPLERDGEGEDDEDPPDNVYPFH